MMPIDREKQFAEVYNAHKELIWNITSKYFSDHWEREDAFQEIFIRVHDYLPSFVEREKNYLKTWLYKIAVTTAINYYKKKKRFSILKEALSFNKVLFGRDPQAESDQEDITALLKPLNEKQRAMLLLREVDGLSYEEIAEIMSIKEGTVKSTLNRAKEKLREVLSKEVVYGQAGEETIRAQEC